MTQSLNPESIMMMVVLFHSVVKFLTKKLDIPSQLTHDSLLIHHNLTNHGSKHETGAAYLTTHMPFFVINAKF